MILRVPGKVSNTVLTLERNIYNVTIYEYSDPLYRGRQWVYPDQESAIRALLLYLSVMEAREPQEWIRATDFEEVEGGLMTRTRRAYMEASQRVIVIDKGNGDYEEME
jgi:hypothetical protein